MFLRKITKLKAIGRFHHSGIRGGEYEKYTLFYGGNGRGKTTLCAILRSLKNDDPSSILERKSFGSLDTPEADLLLDIGITKFSNGNWNVFQPDIHIFDQQFINETVHLGDQVEVDHRRNLYRIAVGPTGVTLALAIEQLDQSATAKQLQIASQKKIIQQHVPKGMTFEAFIALKANSEIALNIKRTEAALTRLMHANYGFERRM